MPDRSLVLVVSNDLSLAAAKTSRHLCRALDRMGYGSIGRDTRLIRWAAGEVEKESPERREAYESAVVAKWNKFANDYGFDTVISLDLHWLFSGQLFTGQGRVKQIHSFWFDDLRTHFKTSPMFSLEPKTPMDFINDPKVTHHCYGRGQMEEMRLLGVRALKPSKLAAPSEYLDADTPPAEMTKLGFIGNPGLSNPPSTLAMKAMERGSELSELRQIARAEVLASSDAEPVATWVKQCPTVEDLLAAATETRVARPHESAISILLATGKAFPEAFDFLNRSGLILDVALLVKLVNQYDRPALVYRLWKKGWLDVLGTPEQWAHYGIVAQPTIPFTRLASIYRRYPAHLNGANCARDATANEKLFEIAACGRMSLNLDSPDVRVCYGPGEIGLFDSIDAVEVAAEEILRDPTAALESGEKARQRTAREHLWEHRLAEAFA